MGFVNSALVHCSQLTSQLLHVEQKKKKKKTEKGKKRRTEMQTPKSVQSKRVQKFENLLEML